MPQPQRPGPLWTVSFCVAVLLACLAPDVGAQVKLIEPCGDMEMNCDVTGPTITISPGQGTFTEELLPVVIEWSDDYQLNGSTQLIRFNGVNVTSSFTYSGGWNWGESSGTLRLVPGAGNQLEVYVQDMQGNPGSASATYTYNAPQPPAPAALAPMDLRAERPGALVTYRAHVQANGGWTQAVRADNEFAGTVGEAKAMQALSIQLGAQFAGVGIEYQPHVGYEGWTAWVQDGTVAGHPGQTLKELQAIRIRLRNPRPGMRVCYRAHVAELGWLAEVCDGADAGTTGQNRAVQAIQVRMVSGPDPVVSLLNPDAVVDRGLCLSAAVPGGAYECGDLRLAHTLPAVRTMNKTRALTLLYGSQHVNPYALVATAVTLDPALGTPTNVTLTLRRRDNQQTLATQSWSGWGGGTRRLDLGFDAQNLATGVYPYTLEVTAWYGSTPRTAHVDGELPIVNRWNSPFGGGWWLAGLESLVVQGGSRMLWVGGDGSTRVYEPTAAGSAWVAKHPGRSADTLVVTWPNGQAQYTRRLGGGGEVHFDAAGRHVRTINRVGQATHFDYDAAATQPGQHRLTQVRMPGGAVYRLTYGSVGGSAPRVWSVVLESGAERRETTFWPQNGDARHWSIREPDGQEVSFRYVDDPTTWGRVLGRIDRNKQAWVAYTYGAAGRLVHAQADGGVNGTADDVSVRFTPAETRGVAGTAALPDSAFTLIDGPRHDVVDHTRFWTGRWGMPLRIRDAAGNETTLTRTDARFPALVTRVDYPRLADGTRRTVSAEYDARGNVAAQTDWSTSRVQGGATLYATTRYERTDARWPDFVTRVVAPEGEVTRTGYHADGNRAWQQPGDDLSQQVTFQYYTDPNETGAAVGLLKSVTHPVVNGQSAVERFQYDARGNLHVTTTPKGYRTTLYNDALGRTYWAESPIDGTAVQVQETVFYPNTDRVEISRTAAPALNGAPAQTLSVRNTYDAEGNPRTVSRRSDPDPNGIGWVTTEFRYDVLGRKIAEIAPDGQIDSTYYDLASNVTRVRTRRHAQVGAYITMQYDVLNQMVQRVTPQVQYQARDQGLSTNPLDEDPTENPAYPRYPNDGGSGYRIPADVATFTYEFGNLTSANNGDAQISRSYYPNGLLRTETQRIRTLTGADFSRHVYEIGHSYDLSGRRTELKHPAQLAPSATQNTTRYAYDPLTGAPAKVTDALGNQFRYGYNGRGEMESLQYAGGITESQAYDLDGNLIQHQVRNLSGSTYRSADPYLRSVAFSYDWRGKVLQTGNLYGPRDTLTAAYSGLGHAIRGGISSRGQGHVPPCYNTWLRSRSGETTQMDALGNTHQSAAADTLWFRCGMQLGSSKGGSWGYVTGVGRLAWQRSLYQRDTTYYDAAGNAEFETQTWYATHTAGATLRDRASYYGADGSLRATDSRMLADPSVAFGSMFSTAFEEYRYDALGRRVWVRARRYCRNDPKQFTAECNLDKVRRIVWDGDHELYEIQMPGQDGSPHLENDVGPVVLPMDGTGGGYSIDPNPFYGRTGYTHGVGVDRPLSVLRMGYGDRTDATGVAVAHRAVDPFAIFPLWNSRGQADLGVFADGGLRKCEVRDGRERCVYINWPGSWFANHRPEFRPSWWHGSVVEDKKDASGTYYRRNRYYDPNTGRFTQEDPIGLAGGANLYGFAGGDPVNYGDPFGLCRWSTDEARRNSGEQCTREEMTRVSGAAADPGMLDPTILIGGIASVGRAVGGRLLARGAVGLDTNALIAVLEGSPAQAAAVLQAMGGRAPVVSATAVREFLRGGGSTEALRTFLQSNGGRVGRAASGAMVQALEAAGLKSADARVVGSAIMEGAGLLTRDKRILNKMIPGVWSF